MSTFKPSEASAEGQTAAERSVAEQRVWQQLEAVMDPEVPVISIVDLGVVYKVTVSDSAEEHAKIAVDILTTYSGCPAMKEIRESIEDCLVPQYPDHSIVVTIVHTVPWSTERMSAKGRKALKDYGIAPPLSSAEAAEYLEDQVIGCPHCGSKNTELVSPFGATACKAFYRCLSCKEPFEYFKCHIPVPSSASS